MKTGLTTPAATSRSVATEPVTTRAPITPTATHQPRLQEHEWIPQPILLRLDVTRPSNTPLNPAPPPQFTLYADGKVFLTRPAKAGYPHGEQQLLFKQLERKDTCRILNTLDQAGFLDYDPAEYTFIGGKPNANSESSAYLEVNAWKAHKGAYPELPLYIFDELTGTIRAELAAQGRDASNRNGFPMISSALRDTYYLTADFPVDGFEVYPADTLAVWARPLNAADYPNLQWENWTFSALTISYIASKIDDSSGNDKESYMLLRKQGALNLYEYLRESFGVKYYVETSKLGEKTYYAFYARPALPYELPGTYDLNAPTSTADQLKCAPADGTLEIPQPNLIYTLPLP